jgi:succinyl-CoA synthetase beta subunit
VKVGDIVGIAYHVTRRGGAHEEQVGLVLELIETYEGHHTAVVNFAGVILTYPVTYLRIIDED